MLYVLYTYVYGSCDKRNLITFQLDTKTWQESPCTTHQTSFFPRPLNYTRMRTRRKIRLACETPGRSTVSQASRIFLRARMRVYSLLYAHAHTDKKYGWLARLPRPPPPPVNNVPQRRKPSETRNVLES